MPIDLGPVVCKAMKSAAPLAPLPQNVVHWGSAGFGGKIGGGALARELGAHGGEKPYRGLFVKKRGAAVGEFGVGNRDNASSEKTSAGPTRDPNCSCG